MAMNNPERALAEVIGMVSGLSLALQALARTHSDPEIAREALNLADEVGLASLEPSPVPEAPSTVTGTRLTASGNRLT